MKKLNNKAIDNQEIEGLKELVPFDLPDVYLDVLNSIPTSIFDKEDDVRFTFGLGEESYLYLLNGVSNISSIVSYLGRDEDGEGKIVVGRDTNGRDILLTSKAHLSLRNRTTSQEVAIETSIDVFFGNLLKVCNLNSD